MVRFARMCFNWKAIAALAAVGAFVWIVTPSLVLQTLPLLLLAVCLFSMFFMMRGTHGGATHHEPGESSGAAGKAR